MSVEMAQNRQTDQQSKIQGPKLDSSIYSSLVCDEIHLSSQWRKMNYVNSVG